MSDSIELLTYADLIDQLVDFLGANPSAHKTRQAKTAIREAYRNFRNDFSWPYYLQHGRICTVAPYDTGTIAYDLTGGAFERMVTLTDGTWPEWAAYGEILLSGVYYAVADRVTDSILQLDIDTAPHEDVAAGTSYTLMRDTYTLPSDFVSMDRIVSPSSWCRAEWTHPRYWLECKTSAQSSGTPTMYTIGGSPDFMGAMSLRLFPYPDTADTLDFIYQRKGRPMKVERDQGIGNANEGDNYMNFVSGTEFAQKHVGCVIRVSESSGADYPSGRAGSNPFDEERVIMSVNDAGDQITIDQRWLNTHNNAKWTISDPVDLEPGTMTGVFMRRCEWELAIIARMEDREGIGNLYREFLMRHREYATPNTAPRSAGTEGLYARRLAYMPLGDDVE